MPSDRLLVTLLRNLQTHTNEQDTPRLLSTASHLLITLSNPRNLTVLTSQLLSAPALWTAPDGLRDGQRFFGTFQSAAFSLLRHEEESEADSQLPPHERPQRQQYTDLPRDSWVKAILAGTDARSPKWRHLLVIGGLLYGFEARERHGLSSGLRSAVGEAFVKATNGTLEVVRYDEALGADCVTMTVNYAFPLLSQLERTQINYDKLLPVLMGSAFFSREGYRSGYFFGGMDEDVKQVGQNKFTWSDKSASFKHLSAISSQPLIQSMGPLSDLISYTLAHARDSFLIQTTIEDLLSFSRTVAAQWRQTKLSEVDLTEENVFFDHIAMNTTLPTLWGLLRRALFAVIIALRGALGRVLSETYLAQDDVAPFLALQTLHILRALYFISSRLGSGSLTQHTFIYLTSIDILSAYPDMAASFLQELRPQTLGQIPPHPLDRTLDLYFLNTAEHFTHLVPPALAAELLVPCARPYLLPGPQGLMPLFEAAHSVMLSVFNAPQNAEVAAGQIPDYTQALFAVFPHSLSTQQFTFAFKTLMRITSPPSRVSEVRPDLCDVLIDMLHFRASQASTILLPQVQTRQAAPGSTAPAEMASERALLTETLISCLPVVPLELIEEYLPLTATLLNSIPDLREKVRCRERFWEVLSSGGMDVERSAICVAWWGYEGRDMVMGYSHGEGGALLGNGVPTMSGALNFANEQKQAEESKL